MQVTPGLVSAKSRPLWSKAGYELLLVWHFIVRDLSSTLAPATLWTLAAWQSSGADWAALPMILLRSTLYFTLYIFIFCLVNQMVGLEEDRLNKPDRPLVRGLISLHGAWLRWLIGMILFALAGWAFQVLEWTLLWMAVVFLHNNGGWAKHWTGKHVSMALGIVAQLGAAWSMVTPLTPAAAIWIGTIAWVMLPLVAVQDLRDMLGDRRIGRRTLPLVWGEWPTRWWLCLGFVGLAWLLHTALFMRLGQSMLVWACDLCVVAICLLLAVRSVWLPKTLRQKVQQDHQTYLLFTYWYCAMLLSGMILL